MWLLLLLPMDLVGHHSIDGESIVLVVLPMALLEDPTCRVPQCLRDWRCGRSRFFSYRLRHQAYLRNPKISRVHFGYNVGIQLGIWLHRANADLRHGVVKDAPRFNLADGVPTLRSV